MAIAAMIPIIATTIRSSISEKPSWRLVVIRVWCSLKIGVSIVFLAPPAFRSLSSRALREVSLPALTTCVPLALFARTAKKRSFLIEILLGKRLDHEGRQDADKIRHSRNDAFRQGVSYWTRAGCRKVWNPAHVSGWIVKVRPTNRG